MSKYINGTKQSVFKDTKDPNAATISYVNAGLAGKQNIIATTTGVNISFLTPQEYGSYGTPEIGNITVSLTSAVRGVDQILYHDDSVAPRA
jgi:hypothetical protein